MNTDRYFYSVLKNEDATPYIGGNVIIAADGLGGSGSTVHNISAVEGTPLHDEIFEAAFSDFNLEKAQEMTDYLEKLVSPMADGEPDTSALWASRIVIARCAYALRYNPDFVDADLSDEKVRNQLAEFICIGLENTAEHFSLEKGKYDDQQILPTTLAFVRYNTDEKGTTVAEAVWAGDSRCYVLTKDGLKQLSVDDEDRSGAITNYFFVGNKKPTVLNYKKFEFNEPCVLMAVSDGIFDPYEPHDNLGVEKTLLEHITQSESYDGLMKNLSDFYDTVHGDDATMAFLPIGFDDYKSLQEAVKDRTELITEIWQKFYDLNVVLEVASREEADVRSYVTSRTRDKFSAIINTVLANYEEHKDDLVYTEEVIEKIENAKARIADKQNTADEQRLQSAVMDLCSHLKVNLEESPSDIFMPFVGFDVSSDVESLVSRAKKEYEDIQTASERKTKYEKAVEEREKWRLLIKEREEYYWKQFSEYRDDDTQTKKRWLIGRMLRIWIFIDVQFEKGYCLNRDIKKLDKTDRKTAKQINDFINKNKALFTASATEIETSINDLCKKYRETLDKLFEILSIMPSVWSKVFKENVVTQFGLSEKKVPAKKTSSEADDVIDELTVQKDSMAEAIVNAFAEGYDKTSILDCYFNATRLNTFRAYYKLKMSPNTEIEEFNKQLQELEANYVLQ